MLPLQTPRLELREFAPADFAAVHRYASDPQVTRYTAWGPNDTQDTSVFLARVAAAAAVEPRQDFELAITLRESGALLGGCGLLARRSAYREYELGYCLARDAWGQGIGSEAARALVGFGFSTLRAHRIFACVDPRNRASLRLVERLGFRREGHQRADTLVNGEWRDSLIYALLEAEPGA